MDLNRVNTEYKFLRNNLYFINGNINQIEVEINKCLDKILSNEVIINQANANNSKLNDWAKNGAEKKLQLAKQQLRQYEQLLETRKIELEYIQGQIDSKLDELKKDPEMKKHIDDVLTLKYERKILSLNNQKEDEIKNSKEAKKIEDLEGQKVTISKIQQLIEEHPSVANNIKGIIAGAIGLNNKENNTIDITNADMVKKYDEYKNKLEQYEQNLKDAQEGKKTSYVFTPSEAEEARKFVELFENSKKDSQIDYQSKIEKNEILLEIATGKSKIEITAQEIIDQLNKIRLKPNVEIDTNMILSEYMSFLDMRIEKVNTELNDKIDAINKNIKRNEIALENVSRGVVKGNQPAQKQQNNRKTNSNHEKSRFKFNTKGYNKQEYDKEKKDRGIGFFNFIKKYKLRQELMNRPELPESGIKEIESTHRKTLSNEKNPYKDGLKYEVVQEYIKQEQEKVENIELDGKDPDDSER